MDEIISRLRDAWRQSDRIFDLLGEELLEEQPILLRHPFLFYLGHLPAFGWNQVCGGMLGRRSLNPDFDDLFERGIDPVGVDRYQPGEEVRWPAVADVVEYRDGVRAALLDAAEEVAARGDVDPLAAGGRIYSVVIEHELMHQETLQYMLQQLPVGTLKRPEWVAPLRFDGAGASDPVEVGGGPVVLGAEFGDIPFGWDNEFPSLRTEVETFVIDRTPVRNGQLAEFLAAGGYDDPDLWEVEDWSWRERVGLERPASWTGPPEAPRVRTLFDEVPLEDATDWPVSVSLAEARAFCRWRGARLPTEAELVRAAYTEPGGRMRRYPWGSDEPTGRYGNFDFRNWAPTPVGAFPDGDSAWGVSELVGNGWEWTSTPFRPFPGFEAYIPTYPGYSADFFDDRHYVMLGASWATPAGLVRRSFRNWFQDHYPYAFATFRCVQR